MGLGIAALVVFVPQAMVWAADYLIEAITRFLR